MTSAFTVEKFSSTTQLLKLRRRVWFLSVFSIFVTLFALKPLLVAAAEDTADPKQRAVETITKWIADKEKLEASRIDVLASDRRFRVPECEGGYGVDYVTQPSISNAQRANATVRVSCDATQWSAVLRVNISAQPQTLVFANDLAAGEIVVARDVALGNSTDSPSQARLNEIVGRSLTRSVKRGERVQQESLTQMVDVYITTSTVLRGEPIQQGSYRRTSVDFAQASVQQRLTPDQISASVARRDLREGTTLTLSDLQFASNALVATTVVEQGSMFDVSNFEVQAIFERLPQDAVLDPRQLMRATTKRRLTPGDVIRYSDVRMQPHVGVGESVLLTVNRGSVVLTVEMEARGDGYIGDKVELSNPESGEIVMATVTGVGEARRD
ncbi:MAG: flagellar basal body P-ring formation chaperone FlgA [Proteobacteria bacterium]|nr:flagellar basal body P-ring formation chaperone FlgA [Pseudomonadota bacterium]